MDQTAPYIGRASATQAQMEILSQIGAHQSTLEDCHRTLSEIEDALLGPVPRGIEPKAEQERGVVPALIACRGIVDGLQKRLLALQEKVGHLAPMVTGNRPF